MDSLDIYWPTVLMNIILTFLAYSFFPIIIAVATSNPVRKKTYRWMSIGVNIVVFIIIRFTTYVPDINSTISFWPLIIWTSVAVSIGNSILRKKNCLIESEDQEPKVIFYCKNCDKVYRGINSDKGCKCKYCDGKLLMTDFPCDYWGYLSNEEINTVKERWLAGNLVTSPSLLDGLKVRIKNVKYGGRQSTENMIIEDIRFSNKNDLSGDGHAEYKFVCKACGNYSTGWYQTCPNCNAVGKMEKVKPGELAGAKSNQEEAKSKPKKDAVFSAAVLEQKFCRKCGKPLANNAKFCIECGTPIVAADVSLVTAPFAASQSTCPSCGASLKSGMKFCNQCGAELLTSITVETDPTYKEAPPIVKQVDSDTIPAGTTPSLNVEQLPPKLRRAFMFIEDEEWDRAEEYLDPVLDEEPENAYANLGRAMIKVKVGSPFDLTDEEIKALKSIRSYIRARKYAEGSLKELFDYWENK